VSYFILAYAGAWIPLLPVVLSSNKSSLGLFPYTVPFIAVALLFLIGAFTGPTLAAFMMTGLVSGRSGIRQLLRRYIQWRAGLQWYLLVLFGYPVVLLIGASVVLGATPLHALLQKWPLLLTSYLPAVLGGLIITAGEEPGWRGFALPRLQQQRNPVLASVILGVLHAFWHLPAFFIPFLGLGSFSGVRLAVLVVGGTANTVLWTWVFNNTKGSLLIAMLVHSSSDAAVKFVFITLVASASMAYSIRLQLTFAQVGVYLACALLVIIFTGGTLSYRKSRHIPAPDKPSAN
jgi:membrane protease YdiL (CAAX protease family)